MVARSCCSSSMKIAHGALQVEDNANLTSSRYRHQLVTWRDKILAVGGQHDDSYGASQQVINVIALDLNTRQWSLIREFKQPGGKGELTILQPQVPGKFADVIVSHLAAGLLFLTAKHCWGSQRAVACSPVLVHDVNLSEELNNLQSQLCASTVSSAAAPSAVAPSAAAELIFEASLVVKDTLMIVAQDITNMQRIMVPLDLMTGKIVKGANYILVRNILCPAKVQLNCRLCVQQCLDVVHLCFCSFIVKCQAQPHIMHAVCVCVALQADDVVTLLDYPLVSIMSLDADGDFPYLVVNTMRQLQNATTILWSGKQDCLQWTQI